MEAARRNNQSSDRNPQLDDLIGHFARLVKVSAMLAVKDQNQEGKIAFLSRLSVHTDGNSGASGNDAKHSQCRAFANEEEQNFEKPRKEEVRCRRGTDRPAAVAGSQKKTTP